MSGKMKRVKVADANEKPIRANIKYTLFFMSAKLLLILNAGKQTRLEAFHHGLEISNAGKKFI